MYSNRLIKLVTEIKKYYNGYCCMHRKYIGLSEKIIENACQEYYNADEDVSAISAIESFVASPGPIEFEMIS